jgi:hypothetical protein
MQDLCSRAKFATGFKDGERFDGDGTVIMQPSQNSCTRMSLNAPTKSPDTRTNTHKPAASTLPRLWDISCRMQVHCSSFKTLPIPRSTQRKAHRICNIQTRIWSIGASARAGVAFECRRTGRWWLQLRGVTVPGIELCVLENMWRLSRRMRRNTGV